MEQNNGIIIVRPMKQSDVPAAAGIEEKCFSEPWSEKAFTDALSDKNYIYMAAEAEDEPAGYAGCVMTPPDADITNIAVDEKFRNRGIGRALMEGLLRALSDRNIENVFLEVRESNNAAIRLYEREGFEKIGMRKKFYCKPVEDAILMAKKLQ